jgi:TolA-binding protein
MYGMQFGLALAAVGGLGDGFMLPPSVGFQPIAVAEAVADSMRLSAPAPWLRADPADSLYRAAREALNRRDYRAAATLFAQIPARFPKSGYAADALYWQAFALYRLGGDRELRLARDAPRRQRVRFP